MKLLRLESAAELRRRAPAWDDLWRRSESYLPTHRAELLAQWLECFARRRRFVALAVEDGGQLVAALPLVGERKGGVVPVGALASNCWSESGTLLLDPLAPTDAVDALVSGVWRLRWPLLSLEAVDLSAMPWRRFQASLQQQRIAAGCAPQYHAGLVDITHDWEAYVASLSGNHRGAVKRSLRKLQREGDVQLRQFAELRGDEIQPLLQQAFEIEDKSWKGQAGSSILRTPGMFDFFLRQAQQLAAWGQMELLMLTLDGRPIAFEYCYVAKGATASHKIGYDPQFKQYGPGRLLRYLQLERYFADPQRRLLDTLGVMCESKARWCTRSYPASRLTLATAAPGGAALFAAYTRLWPKLRQAIGRRSGIDSGLVTNREMPSAAEPQP